MPFVTIGWEIKNQEQSIGLTRVLWWFHQWRLPLLFFISGAGIHFSLRKRSILSFSGERIVRLLIPLLFAMFFIIPLQVYFEKIQRGLITGSYTAFYPTVWELVPYPKGTLTWSHMWFVVYLFVFCILLLPVLSLFKIKLIEKFKSRFINIVSGPFTLFIFTIPLFACYYFFFIDYPEQGSLLDDWYLFLSSFTLLCYGYFLAGSEKFWNTCEKYRSPFLFMAMGCIAILYYFYWWQMKMPKENNIQLYAYGLLNTLHVWTLILAIIGFAKKHLNFSNRFLHFNNQAVYPYYILHQTIIVSAGFYVVQLSIPIVWKMCILVVVTFMGCYLLFRYLIKPFSITRILYGLKPKEKRQESPV